MDVLYVLGTGSHWQDNELRYSLRSLEMYAKGYRRVFIAGELPTWLTNVIHIPCKDGSPIGAHKERNIYQKILAACSCTDLSPDFLFCNDDYFFLQPFDVKLPFYCDSTIDLHIQNRNDGGPYRITMSNTLAELNKRGCKQQFFDIHVPIVYNKKVFPIVFEDWNWRRDYGYLIKSAYVNSLGIKGEWKKDCKVNRSFNMDSICTKIENMMMFSVGDSALNADMKQLLELKFPRKSQFEE